MTKHDDIQKVNLKGKRLDPDTLEAIESITIFYDAVGPYVSEIAKDAGSRHLFHAAVKALVLRDDLTHALILAEFAIMPHRAVVDVVVADPDNEGS